MSTYAHPMTTYRIFRENFQANTWDPLDHTVTAIDPEQAVRGAFQGRAGVDVFGTYVAISTDEIGQFMEDRTRVVITAHIEVLEPAVRE